MAFQNLLEKQDKVDASHIPKASPEDVPKLVAEYLEKLREKFRTLPYVRDVVIGFCREADQKGVFDKAD